MSLLKRRLIQAIRKQSEGVREEEVTYVWLMALNTELNGVGQGRSGLKMIINVTGGVAGDYRPSPLSGNQKYLLFRTLVLHFQKKVIFEVCIFSF